MASVAPAPTGSGIVATPAERAVDVHGNVGGSIVNGDNNWVVNGNYGTIIAQTVVPKRTRRPPAPAPRAPVPFVGRTEELSRLGDAIRAGGATVSGAAGAGRTACLRAAANQSGFAPADGVLRIDGVDEAGTALTIADLAQRLHDAAWETVPRAKVTLESARSELGNVAALALVDDVTLPGSEFERLADLLPAGTMLIATGEARSDSELADVALRALERADAMVLLEARAGMVRDPATARDLDALCAMLGDWPGALVVAGRAIAARTLTLAAARNELDALVPGVDASPLVALERAWGLARPSLDPNARRLLATAAALPGRTHDPALLRRILDDPDWFEAAAETLAGLGLLTLNSPRLRMPDGIRDLARDDATTLAPDVDDRHLGVMLAAARERALDPEFAGDELGGLLGALDHATRHGRLDDAVELGRAVSPQLVLHGWWDAWRTVTDLVRVAAERANRMADVAWATHELGTRDLARFGFATWGAGGGGGIARWLLGGAAVVVGLILLGALGPPAAAYVVALFEPDETASPGPTSTPEPSSTPTPPPELVATPTYGPFEYDWPTWVTTLEITLSGGVGDYRVTIDGAGESTDNPAVFRIQGETCDPRQVTGSATSGTATVPIAVDVVPVDCPTPTPPPPAEACVTFDDLDVGTSFGADSGQRPGDVIYETAEGIQVSVFDFLYATEGGTFNTMTVVEPSGEFGHERHVFLNNINVQFDYFGLPFVPTAVVFLFRDEGGNENFSVNGSDVYRSELIEAPSPIGGASWSWEDPEGDRTATGMLKGRIDRFLVGGQEFFLDEVCAYP